MGNEEQNGILGRLIDEVRIGNSRIGKIQTTIAVIEERTKSIPKLDRRVRDVEDDVLVIQTQEEARESIVEKSRSNLRYVLYVLGSLITIGSAYGAIAISLAK